MKNTNRIVFPFALATACSLLASCGDSPAGPGELTIEKANPSGDEQYIKTTQTSASPLRVIVKEGGTASAGHVVTWQVTTGNGTVDTLIGTTGANGIATAAVHLGTNNMTIVASLDGATGSPVAFSAFLLTDHADVAVSNNRFTRDSVAIIQNGTVTFTWTSNSTNHDVIPDDGNTVPDNQDGLQDAPYDFTATFGATGSFYYHCSAHGSVRSGMYGVVTVVP